MRLLLLAPAALLLAAAAPAPKAPRACASDKDCVLIEGVCEGWRAVHRKDAKAARRDLEEKRSVVRCRAPNPALVRPVPACVDKACDLKPREEALK